MANTEYADIPSDDESLDALFDSAFSSLESCKNRLDAMGRRVAVVSAPTPACPEIEEGLAAQEDGGSEVRVQKMG